MKRIDNINEKPNATKKGLRAVIESVEIDDDGNVVSLDIEFSYLHCRGFVRFDRKNIGNWNLNE